VSPSSSLRGLPEWLSSRRPVAEAVGQLLDGMTDRSYLRLKPPQAFLGPCSLGTALRSLGPLMFKDPARQALASDADLG
jgi:hypothetical protein